MPKFDVFFFRFATFMTTLVHTLLVKLHSKNGFGYFDHAVVSAEEFSVLNLKIPKYEKINLLMRLNNMPF